MGRINFRKRFSLAGIAPGWNEDHYVLMNNFKFKDLGKFNAIGAKSGDDVTEENLDGIVQLLKEKYKEGSIFISDDDAIETQVFDENGGEVRDKDGELLFTIKGTTVPMEKDDLDDLPPGNISDILEWALGKLKQKSEKNSDQPSFTDAMTRSKNLAQENS